MKFSRETLLTVLILAAAVGLFEGWQLAMIVIALAAILCMQFYFVMTVFDWLIGVQKPSKLKSIAILVIAMLNVFGFTTNFALALWGSLILPVVVVTVFWAFARSGLGR